MRDFWLTFLVTITFLAPEPLATPTAPDVIALERSHFVASIAIGKLVTVEEVVMVRLIYQEPSGAFHLVEARRLALVTVREGETVRLELRLDETMVFPVARFDPKDPKPLRAVRDYLIRQIKTDYLNGRAIDLNRILNGISWCGMLRSI